MTRSDLLRQLKYMLEEHACNEEEDGLCPHCHAIDEAIGIIERSRYLFGRMVDAATPCELSELFGDSVALQIRDAAVREK